MEAVERLIGELEVMDRELLSLGPAEFGHLEARLARREVLINALATKPLGDPERVRLRVIWQNGQRLDEKLRGLRAAIKEQVQDLYREGFLLRALAATLDPPQLADGHSFDYSG